MGVGNEGASPITEVSSGKEDGIVPTPLIKPG